MYIFSIDLGTKMKGGWIKGLVVLDVQEIRMYRQEKNHQKEKRRKMAAVGLAVNFYWPWAWEDTKKTVEGGIQ